MRTSQNQYKDNQGKLVFLEDETNPDNLKLWNGYDYDNQYWVLKGKRA